MKRIDAPHLSDRSLHIRSTISRNDFHHGEKNRKICKLIFTSNKYIIPILINFKIHMEKIIVLLIVMKRFWQLKLQFSKE